MVHDTLVLMNLHRYRTSWPIMCLNTTENKHTSPFSLKPPFNPRPLLNPRLLLNPKLLFRTPRKQLLNLLAPLKPNLIEVKTW